MRILKFSQSYLPEWYLISSRGSQALAKWVIKVAVQNKQVIADRLKLLRKTYGLSQQEFAIKVGLSQSAISQFEKAERMPSATALESIANAFSLPFSELVAGQVAENDIELLIAAVAQKLRGMSKDDILSLDRFVDRMGPAPRSGPQKDETP